MKRNGDKNQEKERARKGILDRFVVLMMTAKRQLASKGTEANCDGRHHRTWH